MRTLSTFLLLLATSLAPISAHAQQAPPQNACAGAPHRAFDFWLGEWEAFVTGTDTLAGRSTIAAEDNGCVITEHWRSARTLYTGRSLNLYDAASGHWRQFWVDSAGDVTVFTGDALADGMRLTAEGDLEPGGEAPVTNRMTFTRNADGSVRQHGEQSRDDGHTWVTRYDFTYRRPRA